MSSASHSHDSYSSSSSSFKSPSSATDTRLFTPKRITYLTRLLSPLYPDHTITPLPDSDQGGCSHTLILRPIPHSCSRSHLSTSTPPQDLIIQLRPIHFALDTETITLARSIYGDDVVPDVRDITIYLGEDDEGLNETQVYEMNRLPGISYSHLIPKSKELSPAEENRQIHLVKDLATFLARGLQPKSKETPATGLEDKNNAGLRLVGPFIAAKLRLLAGRLPSDLLMRKAHDTLKAYERIMNYRSRKTGYPFMLNHGDLIPSNILITKSSHPDNNQNQPQNISNDQDHSNHEEEEEGKVEEWCISGIVDWAEAEVLPFGTCFYALEWFLGYLSSPPPLPSTPLPTSPTLQKPQWTYYTCAPRLRAEFWSTLRENGGTQESEWKVFESQIKTMRDVGVLLWYGFAWDEGRINRVVRNEVDATEIECLEAFLRIW